MNNYKLVLPSHLNHFGHVFGGMILQWVDEYAWIAATIDFPVYDLVTIGMDNVVFKKGVQEGSILLFEINQSKTGKTSVQYQVNVFHQNSPQPQDNLIFSTHITFVRINKQGKKIPI